ncbi:MAG: hypothetical protein FWD03_07610 [Defluviitaleaceae bacterium]|nr:hypothetical protein [Defluviitaleaceae bacterium]
MKRLWIFAIVLTAVLMVPVPIHATGGGWTERELELVEIINSLQEQLREAQQRPDPPPPRPQPTPTPQNPNVRLVQPQSISISPGETQYIDVVVRNIGNGSASNTLVTASSEGPFSIEFLNNSNVIGTMAQNNQRIVRMRIVADANAASGTYSINLESAFRTRDGTNETSPDSISVRIDARAMRPQVMLRDFAIDAQHISPGDSFAITAGLVNLGEGAAYGVQAAIVEGVSADGIFVSGSSNAPFIQTVQPGHHSNISFAFTASAGLSGGGTFPIVFELSGRDHAGEDISQRFTYVVTVIAPSEGANRAFISVNVNTPAGAVGVGERANVHMEIRNTGSLPARNIRIDASPDTEAIVPQSASRQTIGVLEPGAVYSISFAFSPTSEAASQYHTVGFEVTYDTGASGDLAIDTFEQFAGINVNNPDRQRENRGNRPRMLISAYTVEPMIVSAGREFDLFLTFQNASSDRTVYNIKVTLEAIEHTERQGAVFTPVGASNTLFIESLGPRETIDQHLRMFAVPAADPRTYNIEVTFEYEDADFEEYTETEQISINVRQITRLEVSNLSIPSHAMAFQPVFVDFNIINSGRVSLANLRIEMEGDFDTSGMDIFAGNLGRGNSANFMGNFTPMEPGEHHGVLIVSGEDDTGDITEVRHEFVIFVEDMMGGGEWDYDMMGGEFDREMGGWDESGAGGGFFGQNWLWIAVGVLVVIVGAIVGIVVVNGRRGKKADVFEGLQ